MATELKPLNRRSERGAEVIEFAIVLPLLLLIVFGIIDFGFMFQRYVVLTNAAVEGARVASLPGYADLDAQTRALDYISQGGIPNVPSSGVPCRGAMPVCAYVATVDLPGSAPGETWPGKEVTVTYVYNYSYIGPIASMFGGGTFTSVTLNARSTMRSQSQPPAGGGS
jgi:Flp pilus assembly protein TadG